MRGGAKPKVKQDDQGSALGHIHGEAAQVGLETHQTPLVRVILLGPLPLVPLL